MALQNRTMGARKHAIRLARGQDPITLSESTIKRRFQEADLPARVIRRVPLLTQARKAERLRWAKERVDWPQARWHKIIYDDEKIFYMAQIRGRRYCRRGELEAPVPLERMPTVKHSPKICAWGCFSVKGVGELLLFSANLTGRLYTTILKRCLRKTA